MKKNIFFISALVLTVLCTSCKDFLRELDDVENSTLPDRERVFANPDDYPSVVKGLWSDWYWANNCWNCDSHLSVAAQGLSCSWGNWGMRESGTIPRIPFVNDEGHSSIARAADPWYNLNGVVANSNELLKLIINPDDPKTIIDGGGTDITQMVLANTYALSGLSLGGVSILFDQGYAATDVTDPVTLELEPAANILAASIYMLDKAISIAGASSFNMGADYINGVPYSSAEFVQLLNSFKARFIMLHARSGSENSATDWGSVLSAANSGVQKSFAPLGDGWVAWADVKKRYLPGQVWARVNQRMIADVADPVDLVPGGPAQYPWPDGVASLPPLTGNYDDRIDTDFTYSGAPGFPASRGYYFFGSYSPTRYLDYVNSAFTSEMPFLTVAENDLMRAEALVRTGGDKTVAAGLINNTRVNRGGLAALTGTEADAALLDAIMYERRIELIMDWGGLIYGDRRRTDSLESGTFPQMPVPARELNLLGLPIYSFP